MSGKTDGSSRKRIYRYPEIQKRERLVEVTEGVLPPVTDGRAVEVKGGCFRRNKR